MINVHVTILKICIFFNSNNNKKNNNNNNNNKNNINNNNNNAIAPFGTDRRRGQRRISGTLKPDASGRWNSSALVSRPLKRRITLIAKPGREGLVNLGW